MKKDTKIAITLMIIAIIITVTIFFITKNNKEQENTKTQKLNEKYVNILQDGSKINTSSNLQQTKKIDGLEVTDIEFTESENRTILEATVTNISSTEQGGYSIDIKILDEKGNEKGIIPGYISKLQPNESTKINESIRRK